MAHKFVLSKETVALIESLQTALAEELQTHRDEWDSKSEKLPPLPWEAAGVRVHDAEGRCLFTIDRRSKNYAADVALAARIVEAVNSAMGGFDEISVQRGES